MLKHDMRCVLAITCLLAGWSFGPRPADAAEGEKVLKGQRGSIRSVAFSPDGKQLLASGSLETRLWDIKRGQTRWKNEGGAAAVHALGGDPFGGSDNQALFSPDGKWFALPHEMAADDMQGMTVNNRPCVDLRDLATLDVLKVPARSFDSMLSSMAFSPDSTKLAMATNTGPPFIWDLTRRRFTKPLKTNTLLAMNATLRFSPDGKLLVSLGIEGQGQVQATTILWRVATGQPIARLPAGLGHWHCLAFSPDSKLLAMADQPLLAAADQNVSVSLYNTATGKRTGRLRGLGADLLTFMPDGSKLLGCSYRYAGQFFTISTGDVQTHRVKSILARETRLGTVVVGTARSRRTPRGWPLSRWGRQPAPCGSTTRPAAGNCLPSTATGRVYSHAWRVRQRPPPGRRGERRHAARLGPVRSAGGWKARRPTGRSQAGTADLDHRGRAVQRQSRIGRRFRRQDHAAEEIGWAGRDRAREAQPGGPRVRRGTAEVPRQHNRRARRRSAAWPQQSR